MKNKKFWNWRSTDNKSTNQSNQAEQENQSAQSERVLELVGTIAEESWFDDDVTPKMFKDELYSQSGDICVWINSPGGDCVAASQIYNMLREYTGKVTVKIDGIAASAASVIAMAGDNVYISPTGLLMIHNPLTVAIGDTAEMQKAIDMLSEVKESIINAYELKTGLSRSKISHMMDAETWMNAKKAVELGFCDGMLYAKGEDDESEKSSSNSSTDSGSDSNSSTYNGFASNYMYSRCAVTNSLLDKIKKHTSLAESCNENSRTVNADTVKTSTVQANEVNNKTNAESLMRRLSLITH